MTLENKLGINDALELAHEEERLTKKRAFELFDKNILDSFEVLSSRKIYAHLPLPER